MDINTFAANEGNTTLLDSWKWIREVKGPNHSVLDNSIFFDKLYAFRNSNNFVNNLDDESRSLMNSTIVRISEEFPNLDDFDALLSTFYTTRFDLPNTPSTIRKNMIVEMDKLEPDVLNKLVVDLTGPNVNLDEANGIVTFLKTTENNNSVKEGFETYSLIKQSETPIPFCGI